MTWNASSKLRTCWCPPNRWTALCVGLTLCASCAERTSSKPATQASPTLPDATAASTPYTYSPQRDDSPRPGAGPCPDSDGGLRRAAESVLDEYARTSRLPSSEALEFALRSAGVPYVWVRSWAATGPDTTAIDAAWTQFGRTLPPAANWRCGLAVATRQGTTSAVGLVADVLADVSPVPRQGRVGQWLPFVAQLHVDATEVALLALGPTGAPYKLPARTRDHGLVRAELPLASPGRWLFQLLPTTEAGPRPVAEVEVFADTPLPQSPEQQHVPGYDPECAAARCDTGRLLAMLNRARASEKLPPLRRDARLDALAAEHAIAMQAEARLAHDVGAGDAYIRVSPEFPDATLIGENVARAPNLAAAHRALWRSPAHRQNLLRGEYRLVGLGVVDDAVGDVWVCQLFAAQATPSATY